jgi:hypothetical protein
MGLIKQPAYYMEGGYLKAYNTSLGGHSESEFGYSLVGVAWKFGYSPSAVSSWAALGVVGLLVLIRHYKHCKLATFSPYQFSGD